MAKPLAPYGGFTTGESRAVRDDDERRHFVNATDLWWTETSWWTFQSADGRVGGVFYLVMRPNLGVASFRVHVWDDQSVLPWELPYSKHYPHVPLPRDFDLPNGCLNVNGTPDVRASIEILKPLEKYRIKYVDHDLINLDLQFEALMPPWPVGITEQIGHFDQLLSASGSIIIGESRYVIDGVGCRDRTWASRNEQTISPRILYTWGAAKDRGFLTSSQWDEPNIPRYVKGFLWQDGERSSIVRVNRTVTKRAPSGLPMAVEIEVFDKLGRQLSASGVVQSGAAVDEPHVGMLEWETVVHWDVGGERLRGEDHDVWPHGHWRRDRAAQDLL